MRGSRTRHPSLRLPMGARLAGGLPRAAAVTSFALVAVAIAVATVPGAPWLPLWARAAFALALVAFAGVAGHVLDSRRPLPRGWLVVDDEGVHRIDPAQSSRLVAWGEPFGVTLLASSDRATLLLALTSPAATRYLAATVRDPEDALSARTVLACATTAASSDLRDGDESALCAASVDSLYRAIALRAPAAPGRVYLSDAAGEAIVLDGTELRVGSRRVDLSAPLEWRASVFQERGAYAASVCQATWVRQGDVEFVLVAPMPAESAWGRTADASVRIAGSGAAVKQSVARDLRLFQGTAGEPPPRELRHAIDRLFMLPIRRALDLAPRASRLIAPSSRPRPEGRA